MQDERRYPAIGDYGLIGDSQSCALVSKTGSIDWCCFPRFDSPSVFAAILDAGRGGRFVVAPRDVLSATRQYRDDSNVLETSFRTPRGLCTLTDCMPTYSEADGTVIATHQILRFLRCQEGSVDIDVIFDPQPDYARAPAHLVVDERIVSCELPTGRLRLESSIRMREHGSGARGTARLDEGQEATFVLSHREPGFDQVRETLSPHDLVDRTDLYWRRKVAGIDYAGSWRDAVVRSFLTIQLLLYRPAGSLVAAPTTSLPEWIGGSRNWDYRYTWLRDAAFTTDALITLGDYDDARAFGRWMHSVCERDGDDVQIMYGIEGEKWLEELELPHLEGYRGSRPVRIGNGAHQQVQHDIYGEVLLSADMLSEAGEPVSDELWAVVQLLANLAMQRWREPDAGLWEIRGGPFHFVESKAMCWAALDRAATLAERTNRAGALSAQWRREADKIRSEVLSAGWSETRRAFVQHYDTDALDASVLLLPLVGLIDARDPRMVDTVRRIREELGRGPFLKRYLPEQTEDGVGGSEGAFLLCSFWLVRVLLQMSEVDEARALFEEILGQANDLGLFAEMVNPDDGTALGNFPQAFSHVGLILAAVELGKAEAGL